MAKRRSVKKSAPPAVPSLVNATAKKPVKRAAKKSVKTRVQQPAAEPDEFDIMAEAELLIQQANAAVYEQTTLGFVSQKKFRAVDFLAKLQKIDWFANVGKPAVFDVTMPVEQVKSWAQADKHLKSRTWEYVLHDSQNQLTQYLHAHCMERYREWNKIIIKFNKEVINPLIKKKWEPLRKSLKLDEKLIASLQSSIRLAYMENAYLDCKHGCFFNSELFRIYEAGHIPCGWKGRWPKGTLLVY